MTSLVTADGRLLKRTGPRGQLLNTGGSMFPPLWSDGERLGGNPDRPTVSYADIYATQPIVAAAVNKLTRQASTLPLRVYKRKEKAERERIYDHELADLLRKPAPMRGAVHLKQWILLSLLIEGNALLAKWREDPDGPPTALLPVDWRYVAAYAAQGGPIEAWSTTQTGEERWLSADDVIHFGWHSGYGEVGVSPLSQLATTVRVEDAAQRYQEASFENGARPSSAVSPPPDTRMSDPEVRAFYREQLESLHKGIDRAGKMALLPPGAKIEPLSFSAVDTQLIQQRQFNREEVGSVYDLAGPLIGDLTHGTYSNITELHRQLYRSVLPPWLTLIQDTLQAQLIEPEERWDRYFAEFDMSEQLKGDPMEQAQANQTEIASGTLTPNEARAIQNRPPDDSDDADKLYLPKNNLTALMDDDEKPTPPSGPQLPPGTLPATPTPPEPDVPPPPPEA